MRTILLMLMALFVTSTGCAAPPSAGEAPTGLRLFAKDNLVAWCIVPFDARKPIRILDHRGNMDAEESLRQNLDGLAAVVSELRGK